MIHYVKELREKSENVEYLQWIIFLFCTNVEENILTSLINTKIIQIVENYILLFTHEKSNR